MPRRSMKSPEQLKMEAKESARAKQKAKENMFLTGGQAKIAAKAPPTNKIDAKDFAVLRAEKAKGRGKGLQDEKVKPGKVMKAKRGKLGEAKDYKQYLKGLKKISEEGKMRRMKSPKFSPANPEAFSVKTLGFKSEDAYYNKMMKDPKFAKIVYKTRGNPKRPAAIDNRLRQLNASARLDRINKNPKTKKMYEKGTRFGGARALKAAKATRIGKIAAGVAGAGLAAKAYLNKKLEEAQAKKKAKGKMGGGLAAATERLRAQGKMGGGMMNKPMPMYNKGGGADTGKVGEMKSKIGVLSNKLRRQGMRLTKRDIEKAGDMAGSISPYLSKRAKSSKQGALNLVNRSLKILRDNKKMVGTKYQKMGGGMMNKPMGYKSGKSVMAKGCKLGRKKPTKMYT